MSRPAVVRVPGSQIDDREREVVTPSSQWLSASFSIDPAHGGTLERAGTSGICGAPERIAVVPASHRCSVVLVCDDAPESGVS